MSLPKFNKDNVITFCSPIYKSFFDIEFIFENDAELNKTICKYLTENIFKYKITGQILELYIHANEDLHISNIFDLINQHLIEVVISIYDKNFYIFKKFVVSINKDSINNFTFEQNMNDINKLCELSIQLIYDNLEEH